MAERVTGEADGSYEWSELVPGGVVVYYADGDERIIHVNRYVLDLFECDTLEEFMRLTGGTFRGFVRQSDVESAEDSIWGQANSQDGLDHVYYQIVTRTGRVRTLDDYGRLVRRDGARPVFYVFVVEMDRSNAVDWLTGLPGMHRFLDLARIEARAMIARGDVPAMVVFDLMGMRTYNSVNGRDAGDLLLRTFASVLRRHFGSELCCRYSGDSFCTLTADDRVEERVRRSFDDFSDRGPDGGLPVMAGACTLESADELRLTMDRAKFASESDRSTWESHLSWYTEEMREEAVMRAYVLDHVYEAIDKGWVRPYYQGLVRTASGAVCGEEALARWIDPTYGFLSPAQFIPILEETGLLSALDMHIIDCVIADMRTKRERGVPLVPVSVNVSLRDLGHINLARRIARRADDAGIPHDLLRVEFTESAATSDPKALADQIRALHAEGFGVWMDDFGSGYSSLNNLGQYDFDLIKLDMGFLYERHAEKSRVIIDGVIRAAKRMGVQTLAEGVEELGQAEALRSMGCDVLQGYHYYRPQPLEDVVSSHHAPGARPREPRGERAYWDAVGSVSLADLAANGDGKGVSEVPVSELPCGIYERRDGVWWMLRANAPMIEGLERTGMGDGRTTRFVPYERPISAGEDVGFVEAVARCERSGSWERISSLRNASLGFQFFVAPLASCEHADAFVVSSTPSLLGAALGVYGDVPVGYAVLRVVTDAGGSEATDAEYVYANHSYRTYGAFGSADLAGKTIVHDAGIGGRWLLPYCHRAAVLKEHVHDVVFSQKAGHWLSLNVAPSLVPDCCVLAVTFADAEQRERERMSVGLATSDLIIATANALNTERDYDEAMSGLLEAMSKVIHPDRLYVYERGQDTTSNTFEWCAPGVEPQIHTLQDMPNEYFAMWEQLLTKESIVLIPNVEDLRGRDDRMYRHLRRQSISRMLAVPLFAGRELIGFLGADNYMLEESLDTHRLLHTIASFAGARIANQRMFAELERLRGMQ